MEHGTLGNGEEFNAISNDFFEVNYPVPFNIKSFTLQFWNQDSDPALTPIVFFGSGSGCGSDSRCHLRSGSGSRPERFSSKDPDPDPAPIDTIIMVQYPDPAPISERNIPWRIFWIRRITRITDICDPRII